MRYLRENRKLIAAQMRDVAARRWFSAAMYLMEKRLRTGISDHIRGRLLDIGSGDQPYGQLLAAVVTRYDSVDVGKKHPGQTYVASASDMSVIPADTYDSALCLSVLEHVANPWQALQEIHRVLKPGGTLILTVPHLSRLHEEPHDYFRFTHHGLKAMCDDAGFEIIELEKNGGLLSFIAHQLSTLLLCLCWRIPGIKQLAVAVNRVLLVWPVAWMDGIIMTNTLAPLNYYAAVRKK